MRKPLFSIGLLGIVALAGALLVFSRRDTSTPEKALIGHWRDDSISFRDHWYFDGTHCTRVSDSEAQVTTKRSYTIGLTMKKPFSVSFKIEGSDHLYGVVFNETHTIATGGVKFTDNGESMRSDLILHYIDAKTRP